MQAPTLPQKQHLESPPAGNCGKAADSEVLIDVRNVSKKFCRDLKKSLWYGVKDVINEMNPWQPSTSTAPTEELRSGEFWAVHDVSFQLRRGECLGLIGHNGAGKTTLLKILNGLIKPDTGFITMRGRVGALIALGAGFNPILTGRENVYINGSILGLSKKEIDEQIDSIIDFAEIREFIDAPVQSYSSGMQVRLGFAVATATQPDVLILDEVLAVGDAAFRTKCFVRISSLLSQAAVIFVSHTEQEISRICTSVLMLQRGKVACSGDLTKCLDFYRQSQPTESAKQNVYHHDAVKKADLLLSAVEHKSGEDLALELHYVTEAAFKLSTHILAMADETGSPVAVCNLLPLFDELKNGENRLKFSIKALSLRPGNYSFGLEVLSDKHSEVLVRKRLSHSIKSSGQIYYWCAYTPSAYESV